jgi:hypothetical protein
VDGKVAANVPTAKVSVAFRTQWNAGTLFVYGLFGAVARGTGGEGDTE